MPFEQVVVLLVAAVAAGWIDAVVGGGGLIQLPALMAVGVPPVQALATNKLSSVAGTASAAVTYARRVPLDRAVAVPAGALSVVAAGLGALAASAVSDGLLRPIVLGVLAGVLVLILVRPALGEEARPELRTRRRRWAAVALTGVGVAFYDGVLGPGTGTFLVMAFTLVVGMDFLHALATARVVNTATNLGALAVFAGEGHVLWGLGAGMAVCNVLGAQLGARTAVRRGAGFVRAVLVCVVSALIVKLGVDQFA
ncbi:hypothetical protein SAMN05421505_118107 [Sinosporangium album]|uniref:Probable membrane transporter protein n=1 Tax=Sinosporangium album TaxID=504805 RepID=A0A1G8DMQ8_9ACTN|nr:TSUP family transporter [Sinosporangium album]SDH58983.1 hypothetical protein SAMN05421505_118107 [Sinosporangium album]